jgi:hypothetical protein
MRSAADSASDGLLISRTRGPLSAFRRGGAWREEKARNPGSAVPLVEKDALRSTRKAFRMFEHRNYREKASEFRQKADMSRSPAEEQEHRQSEKTFATLAANEQWLAENYHKTVHAPEQQRSPSDLRGEEEYVIRCLGAALIMHWNGLPTHLQRELFDTAGAMGDLIETPELRGQIARFLHKYKDGDQRSETDQPTAAPVRGRVGGRELYHSSNGDRWHLARDPESGRVFVRHEPNRASGGQASDMDLGTFLARGDGPEQQALRRLLQALL